MDFNTLTKKKQQLDNYRPFPDVLIHNLDEWFNIELTYTSNAIEGNTLTRQETALVVEKGITVGGKSLKEHLEATNHAKAFNLIKNLAKSKDKVIHEEDIPKYDLTPQQMAEWTVEFIRIGARIVGGCCGTTPEHIAAIAEAIHSQDVEIS